MFLESRLLKKFESVTELSWQKITNNMQQKMIMGEQRRQLSGKTIASHARFLANVTKSF